MSADPRFNPRLDALATYPFDRLRALLADVQPPADLRPISLAAGEPQAAPPAIALDALSAHLADFNRYPSMAGMPALRAAAAAWLCRRFDLNPADVDGDRHLLPVAGTREGVFSLIQTLARPGGTLVYANPFYQIYAGAAVLAGMDTALLPDATGRALAEAPEELWRQCSVLVLCSPHNPTGTVLSQQDLQLVLQLSERHNFVVVSDECYSDLYLDEASPPAGLLAACAASGRRDWRNCVVLHSLSKRSALAGMRTGFGAGDADIMAAWGRYRTYHGAGIPVPVQHASIACWNDDAHAAGQREEYRQRFDAFDEAAGALFQCPRPAGGFYYWLPVRAFSGALSGNKGAFSSDENTLSSDENFVRALWGEAGLRAVPGSYLGRAGEGGDNPGEGHVRLALVADRAECAEAGARLRNFLQAGAEE